MELYGGGLFTPIPWKDFKELYRQFNPQGDGQDRYWLHARHSVLTRNEVKRAKRE